MQRLVLVGLSPGSSIVAPNTHMKEMNMSVGRDRLFYYYWENFADSFTRQLVDILPGDSQIFCPPQYYSILSSFKGFWHRTEKRTEETKKQCTLQSSWQRSGLTTE